MPATSSPLVSVVLPTYNRAPLLGEALASVRAQTFDDWECIVVDDGSTDATPDVLRREQDPRVRPIRIAHSASPAVARNAGLAVARGRLVAFLDDDDLWIPEKLAIQIPLLQDSGCRWSYTGFTARDPHGREVWRSTPERLPGGFILPAVLETRAAIALPTVVAERSLLAEAGGFDPTMKAREDYALWLILSEREPAVTAPQHLTIVRDHPGRLFRPEGNRKSVEIYRRRLAATYLTEASRGLARREWRRTLAATLQAIRWHPPTGVRRALAALGRRMRGPRPN